MNSHPLFAESNARHRTTSLMRTRKLLVIIGIGTLATVFCWASVTFVGDSVRPYHDPLNPNETVLIEVPRLMFGAHYIWDPNDGMAYVFTFLYQLYWVLLTLVHCNLLDVIFCSFAIFACEQLKHLKEIMRPLMELSAALDSVVPNAGNLFRVSSADSNIPLIANQEDDVDMRGSFLYSNSPDYNGYESRILNRQSFNPNGLTKKQELMVRSAIKYWVERHKHVVKYVTNIGDFYGTALLLHMLTSTVTLTLLAYQATKIDGFNLFAVYVISYLFYSLTQVFVFCIHGNELIEERVQRLSQDNRIKQRRTWLLGWATQPACPAFDGGSEVTFKPLVPRLSVREGFLALVLPGKTRHPYFT
ncbi:hypothetical protein J6590_094210 [Homalodisca vitripennis]|nr:hypothetical protein J6590_094210 [Homalodisca vitripennis]